VKNKDLKTNKELSCSQRKNVVVKLFSTSTHDSCNGWAATASLLFSLGADPHALDDGGVSPLLYLQSQPATKETRDVIARMQRVREMDLQANIPEPIPYPISSSSSTRSLCLFSTLCVVLF
jgi:hypothetical protein